MKKTMSRKEISDECSNIINQFITKDMEEEHAFYVKSKSPEAIWELDDCLRPEVDALILAILRAGYPENQELILRSAPAAVRMAAITRFLLAEKLVEKFAQGKEPENRPKSSLLYQALLAAPEYLLDKRSKAQ